MEAVNQTQNQNQKKTPKDEMLELMIDIFGMIGELDIPEGTYLEFADKFKQANKLVDFLSQIPRYIEIIRNNRYYQRTIRPAFQNEGKFNKKERVLLTEAEKAKRPDIFCLCDCGRYLRYFTTKEGEKIIKDTRHFTAGVHSTGIKNRHNKKDGDTHNEVNFKMNRETLLEGFCLIHRNKVLDLSNQQA